MGPYISYPVLNLLVLGVDDVLDKFDVVCPICHPGFEFGAPNGNLFSEEDRHNHTLLCLPRFYNYYCLNNRYSGCEGKKQKNAWEISLWRLVAGLVATFVRIATIYPLLVVSINLKTFLPNLTQNF